jgi:hypothetical protein
MLATEHNSITQAEIKERRQADRDELDRLRAENAALRARLDGDGDGSTAGSTA